MLVFGGGCALAGLAGVIGGIALHHRARRWRPAVGPIVFVVVVVGGMGSLAGAFIASLLIGILQTFAVALDWSLARHASARSASPSSRGIAAVRALGRSSSSQPRAGRCRTCCWC